MKSRSAVQCSSECKITHQVTPDLDPATCLTSGGCFAFPFPVKFLLLPGFSGFGRRFDWEESFDWRQDSNLGPPNTNNAD